MRIKMCGLHKGWSRIIKNLIKLPMSASIKCYIIALSKNMIYLYKAPKLSINLVCPLQVRAIQRINSVNNSRTKSKQVMTT